MSKAKSSGAGYTVQTFRDGRMKFKSYGGFDLRNVPFLNEMGLKPPAEEEESKEDGPSEQPKQ